MFKIFFTWFIVQKKSFVVILTFKRKTYEKLEAVWPSGMVMGIVMPDISGSILMHALICQNMRITLQLNNSFADSFTKLFRWIKIDILNYYLNIIDPKMHALYRAIDIKVGRPSWGKISSLTPNMLRVPHFTRFNPLRPWAPWARGDKKKREKM